MSEMFGWASNDVHVIENTEEAVASAALNGYGHASIRLTLDLLLQLQAGKALAWTDGEYTTSIALAKAPGGSDG